jgi:hypothetical protein
VFPGEHYTVTGRRWEARRDYDGVRPRPLGLGGLASAETERDVTPYPLGQDHGPPRVVGIALLVLALSIAPVMLARRGVPAAAPVAAPDRLDAYRGLGTWVSIYDSRAWADPEAAVADMAGHGVRTLFLQTGNSNSTGIVYDPAGQERFIRAAHARGMKVVAWYLPEMVDMARDFDRITRAIGLLTSDGQAFDSFALDIESTKIHPIAARNAALAVLTAKLRGLVGPSYVLGGIVPSPVGIAKRTGFWNDFPYGFVATHFDVLLPMGYYTYHGKGPIAAAGDVVESVGRIRVQPGAADVPIHMIGGLAAKTTPAEVRAFADAVVAKDCIGASIYSWSGTTADEWKALQGVAFP